MNLIIFTRLLVLISVTYSAYTQIVFPTSKPATQSCKTSSGSIGKCHQGIRRCPGTSGTARPSVCGFENGRPLICCPSISEPIKESKIVSAPATNFKCGKRGLIPIIFGSLLNRRKRSPDPLNLSGLSLNKFKLPDNQVNVVGGTISFRNSWPWMVLLGRQKGSTNVYFCSGIVINQEYVLTAAHCALDKEPFFARFGEHDQQTPSITAPPEDIVVKDIIFHPKYDIHRGYHDIALLRLTNIVTLRDEVQPICLPWGTIANEDLVKEKVTVTGWGTEEFGGRPSRVLREVILEVFDPAICNKSYSELREFSATFPDGMTKDNIVCAGDVEGGKDACQGDSGGPMVHQESDGNFTLAGVISKGFGCGLKEFPGIYAPIRHYETLLWIKSVAFK